MGVENPTLTNKNKYKNDFEKLCISFGKGMSKKDAEQQAAKMSLIIHGALNKDQYQQNDIFYWSSNDISNNEIISNEIISNEIILNDDINDDETDSEYED